ncbi:ABC transporter permease [Saccharothrix sp. NRRL B-16348]|uniref:ABC transporter permease n=1 Tax=Saccharothrix sp. NRRL B-16348 TaxID=1415542 RepID=UPI0006AE921C|nr:ABC transporter permease [Saccharothrix sp. NRRL B-16348]
MTVTKEAELLPAPKAEDLAAVLLETVRPSRPSALSASLTFGWRAVLKIKHVPEQLFDVTAFPIMMILMFTYLFGGALAGSPGEYIQYLLPGITVTSVVMITMYTGVAVNTDIEKGVFDRFRTLPIWRPAPMVGYILGDLLRYVLASAVIMVVGLILGFRPGGGFVGVVLGVAVLVAFSFAFSWVWTMFGLLMRSEKSVMGISMLFLFPLTFLSSVYVDPATMPGWLQSFVNVNPISTLAEAVRALMAGGFDGDAMMWTFGYGIVFTAVFGALTMRLYNRK